MLYFFDCLIYNLFWSIKIFILNAIAQNLEVVLIIALIKLYVTFVTQQGYEYLHLISYQQTQKACSEHIICIAERWIWTTEYCSHSFSELELNQWTATHALHNIWVIEDFHLYGLFAIIWLQVNITHFKENDPTENRTRDSTLKG